MAELTVKSSFVSTVPDGADTTVVRPSNWNAGMTPSTGQLSAGFGGSGVNASAAANGSLLIGNGTGFSLATLTQGSGVTITNGAGTITITATGGASWDTITAAAADGSTNNGVNRIVYNTAPTADTRIAWRFTESSAATNGTSTNGVPNQVLLQLDTLAASTQSPLKVLSRGVHVFSVSPSAMQILAGSGSGSSSVGSASVPIYSFAGWATNGLYIVGGQLAASSNGSNLFVGSGSQIRMNNGTASAVSITNQNGTDSGVWWPADSGTLAISLNSVENIRWTLGVEQLSKGSADAVAYAVNARKSRGTVASPTAITSGDDALTINASAYVGATGTYVTCATIQFTTEGTLANTTTGIGGVMVFKTMNVGSAIAEVGRIDSKGNFVWTTAALATTATDGFIYLPTCAGTPSGVPTAYAGRVPMIFDTTGVKLWIYTGGAWKGVVVA